MNSPRLQLLMVPGLGVVVSLVAIRVGGMAIPVALAGILALALVLWGGRHQARMMPTAVRLLVWTSVLSPSVTFVSGVPALRGEEAVLLCVLLYLILKGRSDRNALPLPGRWLALLFAGMIVVSTLFSTYSSARDLMELVKLGKYLLCLWVGAAAQLNDEELHPVLTELFMATSLSGFIGIAQFFNWLNINDWLSPLLTTTQLEGIIEYGRVIGTTSNPNQFGLLLMFPLALAYSVWMHHGNNDPKLRKWSIIAAASSVVALALTGSRTGIVAFSASLFAISLWPSKRTRTATKLGFGLIVALVAGAFIYVAPEQWFNRMSALSDPLAAAPFQLRLRKWVEAFQVFLTSPVIGLGPSKAQSGGALDSEYMLVLYRYGAVGFLLFAGWLGLLVKAILPLRRGEHSLRNTTRLGLVGVFVAGLVYMVTASFYHDLQIMALFTVLAGVALSPKVNIPCEADDTPSNVDARVG